MSQTNAEKEEGGFESVRLNSVREAAAMLHLPLGTMYKLVWQRHTNNIPHHKIGGRILFTHGDLVGFADMFKKGL